MKPEKSRCRFSVVDALRLSTLRATGLISSSSFRHYFFVITRLDRVIRFSVVDALRLSTLRAMAAPVAALKFNI